MLLLRQHTLKWILTIAFYLYLKIHFILFPQSQYHYLILLRILIVPPPHCPWTFTFISTKKQSTKIWEDKSPYEYHQVLPDLNLTSADSGISWYSSMVYNINSSIMIGNNTSPFIRLRSTGQTHWEILIVWFIRGIFVTFLCYNWVC